MSRCFPFPPPGYEKKARVDDTDLIIKEKHKEKKHKKDKDREKREGKEKKEKDRSKEKHREKKDRKEKEKHKDKEDRKEKNRDKDKHRDREKNHIADDKRAEGQPGVYNEERIGSSSQQNNEKYIQELARRISIDNGASGSQMVQKISASDHRRTELQGMAVGGAAGNQFDEREKAKDRSEDYRKASGQRNQIDARSSERAFGQNLHAMDQERVEGITKSVEKKDVEQAVDGREKSKRKGSDGKVDKQKTKEKEKKSKDKKRDKEKKKEEKANKIAAQSTEQPKIKESSSKRKEVSKDSLDVRNIKPPDTLKLGSPSSIDGGNLGKRKEHEMNGFLLDNGNRPNKILKPFASSCPPAENGRKLEPGQVAIHLAHEKQGTSNNQRVDVKERKINGLSMPQPAITSSMKPLSVNVVVSQNGEAPARPPHPDMKEVKEQKINGLVTAQPPDTSSTRPLPTSVTINENGEASAKSPHPDMKYLSEILSVPKLDELQDINDEEWLFSSNHLQSKEPSSKSPGIDGTWQVWAEAVRIEPADISALPYVIPF